MLRHGEIFDLAHGPRLGEAAMAYCLIRRINHSIEEKILDNVQKDPRVTLAELPKMLSKCADRAIQRPGHPVLR